MPTGSPRNGFRMTKKRLAMLATGDLRVPATLTTPVAFKQQNETFAPEPLLEETKETDSQIAARLDERFDILAQLTQAAILGNARSLIVSGPAGVGKSYTIETELASWDPEMRNHKIVKGFVKATGLFKLLYQHRLENQVLVLDDADSVFFDEVSLNMLKAVCDTNDRRIVSYLADYKMVDEETAEVIPNTFEFSGTIIFLTNLDFDAMISRGHRLSNHLQALISRSHYIDLAMKHKRDYLVRIHQVIKLGLLRDQGLNEVQEAEVLTFINQHSEILRELSLRIALKIAGIQKASTKNWEKVALVTCCRNT